MEADKVSVQVENQLDRFFDLSLDMLCIAGADGYFRRVNPAFTQVLGWNVDELLARPFLDFVHPDDHAATLQEVERQFAGGEKIMHFENRYRHKDGSYRLLSWMSAPAENGYLFATAHDITESRRMEQALREKEQMLSEAQRIAQIGSWYHELATGRSTWSAETYRVYGVSPEAFATGRESFLSLIHPDDLPLMQDWMTACMAGEKPGELVFRTLLPDGTIRYISGYGELKYDAWNKPAALAGTAQNITTRKMAELALQENQRLLESVIENMPSMVFMKRAEDLRFTLLNRAGEELLGYPREELMGRNDHDFFTPEQADFFTAQDRRVLETGFADIPEESISTRNLGTRILHTKKIALHDDKGKPRYLLGISHDITGRIQVEKRMEKSIRELADFKAALDAHAIVATTDAHGAITYVNDKFCAISHYSREELLGRNHRIINSGHHPREFFNELWQTIRSGKIWQGEIKNRTKDGTFYWVNTTIVPFLDEQGVPVQYIAIRADITGRKLTEQKLVIARDEAEQANRAKDSFLATMSHEIRTPLGGLMGMLELLGFTPLNDDQRETMQAAMDSGQSLLRIVNDILDWSKIEAGKLELAPQATALTQLVSGVVNTYARVASARSLILEQYIDVRLSAAHLVDPLRLSQVLNNFVSNALKFTPRGRIEVRAELLERQNSVE